MKIFEGKTPAEKNKLFAAIGLGALALIAMSYAVYSTFSTPVRRAGDSTAKSSPTPKKADEKDANQTTANNSGKIQSPEEARREDMLFALTPIDYRPFSFTAPEATRNIFAFYNPADAPPPPPTPIPTLAPPKPPKPTPTPTPVPPPPQMITYVTPASVYARTGDFTLEVNGDKFTENTKILFNGSELPTRFLSPQKLATTVPAALIAGEGARQIMVRTPDGALYSNPYILSVQAPPLPTYIYVGFQGRKRFNNDVAILYSRTKKEYLNVRLNDTVRLSETSPNLFRVVRLDGNEVLVEDVQLKIRHSLKYQTESNTSAGTGGRNQPGNEFGQPGIMPNPNPNLPYTQGIPGIPDNIPRYNPNQPNPTIPAQPKRDDQKKYDDDEDEDGF